ncbi:hypothetical protein BHE74_00046811 [Ensete ventricosum]|nr:hypothetical protein BHE74_00046811 [Ensete ventricosum]
MAPFVARPSDLAATVPSPRWLPAGPNNRNNVEVSIVELKVGRPEAKNTIEKEMLRRLQFGCQGFLRRADLKVGLDFASLFLRIGIII